MQLAAVSPTIYWVSIYWVSGNDYDTELLNIFTLLENWKTGKLENQCPIPGADGIPGAVWI